MHYFKRNIGDYHKKAGRLSMLEHGAYTLLMDACYDREQFPTLEQAYQWCWARTEQEKDAVRFVLEMFFVVDNGVYVQHRILEEINKYKDISTTNQKIAIDREAKKRTKRARSVHESSTNEHLTNNQEPLTNNHKPIVLNPIVDLFETFWRMYPKKTGKGAAKSAWAKIKPTENLVALIEDALRWQKDSEQWCKDGGQYIPNPSTYLNQQRWLDEPTKQNMTPRAKALFGDLMEGNGNAAIEMG